MDIRGSLAILSPKQIVWVLVLIAVIIVSNLPPLIDPVTAVSLNATRKILGQAPDCPWSRTVSMYWDLADLRRRSTVRVQVLDRDDEFGIVQLAHPGVRRRFWIREQGLLMTGPTLLSYLVGEQQWIIAETPQARIKQGDIVIDAGAHVGVFSDRALREGASKVVAFEPDPIQIECLRRNFASEIEAGKFVLVDKAVWNDVRTITLRVGENNSGMSSLVHARTGAEVEVETTTIDIVVDELRLPRVDVLKLDIEGAEREALAGAAATLKRSRPRLLIDANHRPDDPTVLPRILRDVHADYKVHNGPCLMGDGVEDEPRFTMSYLFIE